MRSPDRFYEALKRAKPKLPLSLRKEPTFQNFFDQHICTYVPLNTIIHVEHFPLKFKPKFFLKKIPLIRFQSSANRHMGINKFMKFIFYTRTKKRKKSFSI